MDFSLFMWRYIVGLVVPRSEASSSTVHAFEGWAMR